MYKENEADLRISLTNYGEINSEVLGARVEKVDAAPVDALVLGLDFFDSQFAGALRRAHEKGPQAESTRHGPVRPRLECSTACIDAATESKTRFYTTSLDANHTRMIEKAHLLL